MEIVGSINLTHPSSKCDTTRFRIEGFDLNLHTDAEFALRDTGRCDRKNSTNVNFFLLYQQENGSEIG